MSIVSIASNDDMSNASRSQPIDSSATSHPRTRRMVLYENDNETGCEIGVWFDVKLTFTHFEQCKNRDGAIRGYDANIHDIIGSTIRESWPELELLHAKLLILPYYYDSKTDNADLQKRMLNFVDATSDFLSSMNRKPSISINKLLEELSILIGDEMSIIGALITCDFRPNADQWRIFAKVCQTLNFWGISFDYTGVFEQHLNRKYPMSNFYKRIADRLKSLIDVWVDDFSLLEFHSVVEIAEISEDMSGDIVSLPLDMESPCYNISGAMVDSKIGLIQSDGIEIQLAIRYNHENMISAKNFHPSSVNEFLPIQRKAQAYGKSHYDRVIAILSYIKHCLDFSFRSPNSQTIF